MKRIVLDENVPRQLAGALSTTEIKVHAFPSAWKGIRNGAPLTLVEQNGFDVLLTGDKNLVHQQNLAGRMLAVVVLSTTLKRHVLKAVSDLQPVLLSIEAGQHVFATVSVEA